MMVLYALALPALIGAIALGADVAVMYVNWQGMQKAADAAALAGAGKLDGTATSDAGAIANAKVYATNNGLAAGEVATPTVSVDHKNITVSASRTVPYYFAQVLGLLSASVQVTATAPDSTDQRN
jgi:Flp pilus assembly protein TadG